LLVAGAPFVTVTGTLPTMRETEAVTPNPEVVEIEAQGDGVLAGLTAKVGDVVPVGRTIGWLLKPGEAVPLTLTVEGRDGKRETIELKAPVKALGADHGKH